MPCRGSGEPTSWTCLRAVWNYEDHTYETLGVGISNTDVEVIRGSQTSSATLDRIAGIVDWLGMEQAVINDAAGFATSRLGVLVGIEAIRMVEEGVAASADIDTAMRLGYRHPMGPLMLGDLVGLDVRLKIAQHLASVYGSRFEPPQLLLDMVAAGRLGKKSGRGFYDWSSGKPVAVDEG